MESDPIKLPMANLQSMWNNRFEALAAGSGKLFIRKGGKKEEVTTEAAVKMITSIQTKAAETGRAFSSQELVLMNNVQTYLKGLLQLRKLGTIKTGLSDSKLAKKQEMLSNLSRLGRQSISKTEQPEVDGSRRSTDHGSISEETPSARRSTGETSGRVSEGGETGSIGERISYAKDGSSMKIEMPVGQDGVSVTLTRTAGNEVAIETNEPDTLVSSEEITARQAQIKSDWGRYDLNASDEAFKKQVLAAKKAKMPAPVRDTSQPPPPIVHFEVRNPLNPTQPMRGTERENLNNIISSLSPGKRNELIADLTAKHFPNLREEVISGAKTVYDHSKNHDKWGHHITHQDKKKSAMEAQANAHDTTLLPQDQSFEDLADRVSLTKLARLYGVETTKDGQALSDDQIKKNIIAERMLLYMSGTVATPQQRFIQAGLSVPGGSRMALPVVSLQWDEGTQSANPIIQFDIPIEAGPMTKKTVTHTGNVHVEIDPFTGITKGQCSLKPKE